MSESERSTSRRFRMQLSRVDWGSGRDLMSSLNLGGRGGVADARASAAIAEIRGAFDAENEDGPSSDRYAPSSVNRLGDLNDLVMDDYDSDSEGGDPDANFDSSDRRNGFRRASVVMASLLMIACGSLGIGAIANNSGTGPAAASASADAGGEPQRLLEIAESVVAACAESRVRKDASDCLAACDGHLCCVDDAFECHEGSGAEAEDCAVYAGCEALLIYPTNGGGAKWGRS